MSDLESSEEDAPLLLFSSRAASLSGRKISIGAAAAFCAGTVAFLVAVLVGAAAWPKIQGPVLATTSEQTTPAPTGPVCPCACSQAPNVEYPAVPAPSRRLMESVSVTVEPITVSVAPVTLAPTTTAIPASVSVAVPVMTMAPTSKLTTPTPLPLVPPVGSSVQPVEVAPVTVQPVQVAPVTVQPVTVPPVSVSISAPAPAAAPGACLAGDRCVFGPSWCAKDGYGQQQVSGKCTKRSCTGPSNIAYYPNQTCSTPSAPGFDITGFLSSVPGKIHEKLQDVAALNIVLNRALKTTGLDGLSVEIQQELASSFELKFESVNVVWLVGCWPPQRYAVVSGVAKVPRGSVITKAEGYSVEIAFSDFQFRFEGLRANIGCHGDYFVLESLGEGHGSGPLLPEAFEVSGEISVHCQRSWSTLCRSLRDAWLDERDRVMSSLPTILADALADEGPVRIGSGCPELLHNTMALLPYASQECCEDSFAEDQDGCLVGGQFNGHVPGVVRPVAGVQCRESTTAPGTFRARCETVPWGYYELSPGVCRESDELPPSSSGNYSSTWEEVRYALRVEPWVELGLLLALCCCCTGCGLICCQQVRAP